MTLVIYGSPRSRTMRVLWAAAELGLDYRHVPLAPNDPALKTPEFLRLNPAGSVPVIVDNGFALAESMAIALYLARTYGSGTLAPATPQRDAEAWRWSLWAQGHLEPWVQRDAAMAPLHAAIPDFARARAEAALRTLDLAVAGREWLVGDRFSVADLNVAGALSPSRAATLDLAPFPDVAAWLDRCYARPAAVATRRRYG